MWDLEVQLLCQAADLQDDIEANQHFKRKKKKQSHLTVFGKKNRSSSQSYQVRVMRVSESTGLFFFDVLFHNGHRFTCSSILVPEFALINEPTVKLLD